MKRALDGEDEVETMKQNFHLKSMTYFLKAQRAK